MNWYCVDSWTQRLELGITQSKGKVSRMITVHHFSDIMPINRD